MADRMIYSNDLTHSIEVPSGFALDDTGHAEAIQKVGQVRDVATEELPKVFIAMCRVP